MTEDIDSIPQANQLLYTMKLRTGDEVLFTLVDEKDDGLVIESPIKVSVYTYVDEQGLASNLITQKWVIFSDCDIFFVPFEDIMSFSPMSKSAYKLYINAVNRYSQSDPDMNEVPFLMEPSSTIQ